MKGAAAESSYLYLPSDHALRHLNVHDVDLVRYPEIVSVLK